MEKEKPAISILLPSYRGADILAKQLGGLLQFMQHRFTNFEIIIIDDGSNDAGKTREVCTQFGVKYLFLSENKGKGAAIRTGMAAARAPVVLFTDVDIPFEYETIASFYQLIFEKQYDLVVGDRTHPQSEYFASISPLRKWGSHLFYFLVSKVFTKGLPDTQCGIKAFKSAVGKTLFRQSTIDGFAFDVEILSLAALKGYVSIGLPVRLRNKELSTVRMMYHGLGMLGDLISIAWRLKTGYYLKPEMPHEKNTFEKK